ncbi:MAG: hypothetical protein HRU17_00530 [Polyangiaceae bacterium]|nr:hypothetical protein [Polyangiaceae bacterium]
MPSADANEDGEKHIVCGGIDCVDQGASTVTNHLGAGGTASVATLLAVLNRLVTVVAVCLAAGGRVQHAATGGLRRRGWRRCHLSEFGRRREPGRIWKSFIMEDNSPITRLEQATAPYVRLDGVRIADNFSYLTDGSLAAPLNVTELGTVAGYNAWTGPIAMFDTTLNCNNWTVTTSDCSGGGFCAPEGRWLR